MEVIPYGKHYIDEDDINAVIDVLKSTNLTQGKNVVNFENNFAKFVTADHALAVSNGTGALHIAVKALGIEPGDKVLCVANTFVASSNCVLFERGTIDFVDIDLETYCVDINKLEQKLNKKGSQYKGIIVVDFAGYPIDMEKVSALAKKYGLWVIEDACHAVGASFIDSNGLDSKVGSGKYADATIFSFHPVKHIATGEGGMITTTNEELYNKMCRLRSHGITSSSKDFENEKHGDWYYEMQSLGFNYRIPDINCALGNSQLSKIESNLKKRREIADYYSSSLIGLDDIITPPTTDKVSHAYHLYVIRTSRRLELYNHLRESNILAQIHYIPVHTQPYYKKLGNWEGELDTTEKYYEGCISIPMYPTLKEEEMKYVVDTIKSFFDK